MGSKSIVEEQSKIQVTLEVKKIPLFTGKEVRTLDPEKQ